MCNCITYFCPSCDPRFRANLRTGFVKSTQYITKIHGYYTISAVSSQVAHLQPSNYAPAQPLPGKVRPSTLPLPLSRRDEPRLMNNYYYLVQISYHDLRTQEIFQVIKGCSADDGSSHSCTQMMSCIQIQDLAPTQWPTHLPSA
jgi:hypothetical protein